ncbi:putative LL-diaminopimelate aminotransferase [Helianthus annuus]|nr:putative LL-diaminopimelate aminotransferase [Helianthus annuus]
MKNQAVTTICGLITGNQLHIYLLLFGLSTTTSQLFFFVAFFPGWGWLSRGRWRWPTTGILSIFANELLQGWSYGLYEVEQGGKQLRAQLASWFYAIIGIEEDGIFVSDGVQFHISCLQSFSI